MQRILLLLLLISAGWQVARAQQSTTDMTVFGLTLGAPFTVPECPCKVVDMKSGTYSGRPFEQFEKYHGYTYEVTDPASGFCFRRKNLNQYTVRRKKQLDSLPPVKNEAVEIVFSKNDAPAMCPTGQFDAYVKNGILVAINFTILTRDADKDFEILKKKYGQKVSVQNYKMQNGYGASADYYQAIWPLPNLVVSLTSSMHRSLDDAFGEITIGLPLNTPQKEDKHPL
jgi:hypothetical protein